MKRQLTLLVVFLLLAIAFVFYLSGCGGDDPVNTGPEPEPDPELIPLVAVDGTVDLPDGWVGDPASLRVVDIVESAPCAGDGTFSLRIHEERQQLALVLGSTDAPVFLGWLSSEATILSSRSTAEVLVWMALGTWMLPGESEAEVRTLLADPALDLSLLEAAWTQMLADSPNGLAAENQALHEALQIQVEGLIGIEGEKGLIIHPGVLQSGVEVLNQGGINRITVKNSYRRRSAAFLWHTGHKDSNNMDHWYEDPELVQEMELPPVDAFDGTIGTILGALTGEMAYEPKFTEPITLVWDSNAKRDYYRFNVLGMGLEEPDNPEIYTSYELAQGEWMALKCLILDYFLPMFLNAAGAYASSMSEILENDIPGQVLDFIDLTSGALPEFHQYATEGQFWPAMHVLWNAAFTNGTLQGWINDLVQDALVAGRFTADEAEDVFKGVDRVFLLVGIVDIVGNLADNTITGYHFGLCKKAETYEVTVTNPVIHIEPREAEITAYDTQLLTLIVDDDTGEYPEGWAYAYHWTCTGRHGLMVDPMNLNDTSNDFTTSSEFVQYIAENGSQGDEEFSCQLFVTLGGDQTYLNVATATVAVTRQHIALADTLKSCPQGLIEMRPYLDPPHEGEGTVVWTWDSPQLTGFLRGPSGQAPPWTSPDSFAKFIMGSEGGDDWVTCIASIDYGEGVVSAVDTVEAFIEDISEFQPYSGEHFCYTIFTDNGQGFCTQGFRIAVRFREIPGVLRYRIHGTGFNDTMYYGTEYDNTIRAQYLERSGDMFMIGLTSGSSTYDCENPQSEEELCQWMWRFEGAVWEITPVCP